MERIENFAFDRSLSLTLVMALRNAQSGGPSYSLQLLTFSCLAAGVSDSIVYFANERAVDMVVVGSRGMGAFKR